MFFFQESPISGCFPGHHQNLNRGAKFPVSGFYIYFFFELEQHFHGLLSLTASLMRQKMTLCEKPRVKNEHNRTAESIFGEPTDVTNFHLECVKMFRV